MHHAPWAHTAPSWTRQKSPPHPTAWFHPMAPCYFKGPVSLVPSNRGILTASPVEGRSPPFTILSRAA